MPRYFSGKRWRAIRTCRLKIWPFYRFADLIEQKDPQVVVLENVAGLLNSNHGRDFLGVILNRMTSMGYSVAWRLLNTR